MLEWGGGGYWTQECWKEEGGDRATTDMLEKREYWITGMLERGREVDRGSRPCKAVETGVPVVCAMERP
jgi:hypothetical protein